MRAIFVEAILNRTPWRMWDLHTGEPAPGAGIDQTCRFLPLISLPASKPCGSAPDDFQNVAAIAATHGMRMAETESSFTVGRENVATDDLPDFDKERGDPLGMGIIPLTQVR
ncbi:MAG: hypothetical protein WBQ75_08235 [Acetobacteraceae bacterium]